MALLSGSLLLRVIPPDFQGCAAVSGAGGLWIRCFADLASARAPAFHSTLIAFRRSLPSRSDCSFSMNFVVIEL
jgi:hypothetical protein